MWVITYKKVFIAFSATFIALSIAAVAVFGLPFGIDFNGGSALTFRYTTERPEIAMLEKRLTNAGFGNSQIQHVSTDSVVIKTRELTETERSAMVAVLHNGNVASGTQESFTSIGPSVGAELKQKAITTLIIVLIAIILFVAYAFRKVSRPVSSWKYGFAVIVALLHDVIIQTGAFAIISEFTGTEADTLFIVALLTTLALSIADTIVAFDRIRENLGTRKDENDSQLDATFPVLVGNSISQTFARSINTSLMVLVMVVALAVFGPASTTIFATILAIGMFFGIYSSIFLASPLLVIMHSWQKKK